MSEEHQHTMHYTVILRDRHWWGGRVVLHFVGVASSTKDRELLIFEQGGSFHSINFARVLRMHATPVEHQHEA